MSFLHAYIPRHVRTLLATFPAGQRLEIETHIENLAMMVAGAPTRVFATLPTDGDFFQTEVAGVRVFFTVDPGTGVVFVQRITEGAAEGRRTG